MLIQSSSASFNIVANSKWNSEKLLLLSGEDFPLQSSDTWSPSHLVPSDDLPFNGTVLFKFSYNKDKIVTRNTLFSKSLAFGNSF